MTTLNNLNKSFLVLFIIHKYSNIDSPISSNEIKEIFTKEYHTSIDIRTIETTIQSFNNIQDEYEIEIIRSKPNKYYFSSQPGLDLGEAKAIIDLIYSSHFFTENTKNNFIEQMKSLFDMKNKDVLNKRLNTHVCRNEDSKSFYHSFEKIALAISTNQKITFKYLKPSYEINNKNNLKKKYCPIEIVCENNNFYLYCYEEETQKERNYRIDYIHDVILTGITFEPNQELMENCKKKIIDSTLALDPKRYADIVFKFNKEVYANMIDKFGTSIKNNIHLYDENHYSVLIHNCPISSTFYGWIIGFEGKIQIIGNYEEVKNFKTFLLSTFIEPSTNTQNNFMSDFKNLTVRSYSALKNNGIYTIQDLIEYREEDLLKLKFFNEKCILEIKNKLKELGYSLKK